MSHSLDYFLARGEILAHHLPWEPEQTTAVHSSISGANKQSRRVVIAVVKSKAGKSTKVAAIKDVILLPNPSITSVPHGRKREELYVRKLVATAFEIFSDMSASEIYNTT